MSRAFSFIGGLGLGAGLMYVFDPLHGARRRAVFRDKVASNMRSQRDLVDKGVRDIAHRIGGVAYRVRHPMTREVPDDVLEERVRARLGRHVSHLSSLGITTDSGVVTLAGPILAREARSAVKAARKVPGVIRVEDNLERHQRADEVPGLQGEGRLPERLPFRDNWPPAVRLGAAVGGGALIVAGIGKQGILGGAMALAGAALAVRGVTNMSLKRLVGIGAGRRAIDLTKTITVEAPVDEVYSFWCKVENFPRFMDHIEKVHVSEADPARSHWEVRGPARTTFRFDAEVTRKEENRIFAWKTLPGASVEHAGIIHFEPGENETTRLHIQMSYNPPAGALGHVVARIFGADPKRALDEDLVRMKSLLEEGRTRAHGERVTVEDLR